MVKQALNLFSLDNLLSNHQLRTLLLHLQQQLLSQSRLAQEDSKLLRMLSSRVSHLSKNKQKILPWDQKLNKNIPYLTL